jgi:hypothetical protein
MIVEAVCDEIFTKLTAAELSIGLLAWISTDKNSPKI